MIFGLPTQGLNFVAFYIQSGCFSPFQGSKLQQLSTPYYRMSVHNIAVPPVASQQSPSVPRYKSFIRIILIAMNLGLSNLYFGYSLVYISSIEFKELIRIYDITMPAETARGILTGCIPVGAGIGALLGRKFIHVFSRRHYVLFINAIAIIAGSVIFVNHMVVFLIMRIIQGICVGMYTSVIPLYINQISPVEIESSTAPFTQIFASGGSAVAYLFYYILSITVQNKDTVWYLVLGFTLVPLVFQTIILLFIFPYETPKYLILNHHKKQAYQLIAELYKPEFVDAVYHQKLEDLDEDKGKVQTKTKIQANTKPIGSKVKLPPIKPHNEPSVSESLQGEQIEQPVTPGIAIFAAIHLMILRQLSGINAVVAYGGQIISRTAPGLRAIVPVILNFQITLGAIIAICILHRLGKKTLLQIGTTILSVSVLVIAIGFFIMDNQSNAGFEMILAGLVVFTFTFGVTYGAIIWPYVSSIVEPSYDILATTMTWVFASIVIILFPIIKSSVLNGNPAFLFLFFCIWLSVSFFVNQGVLIETRNKTQHQIREEYMQVKCNCICVKKEEKSIELTAPKESLAKLDETGQKKPNFEETKMQVKAQS